MSKFLEIRFPISVSMTAIGGPTYETRQAIDVAGNEERAPGINLGRCSWEVRHAFLSATALAELVAFFRVTKGSAYGFRFKDWTDHQAMAENIGIGDGNETDFQLTKTYTYGGESVARQITKPVDGTVVVYVDDVSQGSGWTVDTTTGVVTFDTAPGVGEVVTADFEFDVPCRFEDDAMRANVRRLTVGAWDRIRVIELA